MTINVLRQFFMWCMVLNGAVLMLSFLFWLGAKEWICQQHQRLFGISQEQLNFVAEFFFIGYKLFLISFNLIPYLALLILSSR